MLAVFAAFLRLGVTSFGGPIAHLSYFRREFVERRGWLDDAHFTQIVAFCSVLPGPTSSQVGMLVGLLRAGPAGAVAAWLGFTLPSALILTAAAAFLSAIESGTNGAVPRWLAGALAGLAAAATGIVAAAVLSLARTQCPDRTTGTIAACAAALALVLAGIPGLQWVPIAAGALAGTLLLTAPAEGVAAPADGAGAAAAASIRAVTPQGAAVGAGVIFAVLALIAIVSPLHTPAGIVAATFLRAGSLVFGGGHVVLPLLGSLVTSGLVSSRDFYAGYGLTQAMPGPLFTFAAFLGSVNASPLHGPSGALIATVLIFVPSFALIFAGAGLLHALRTSRAATGALRGANAAVVGLLGALLYSPLIAGLQSSLLDTVLAIAAFTLVAMWKLSPVAIVVAAAAVGSLGVEGFGR